MSFEIVTDAHGIINGGEMERVRRDCFACMECGGYLSCIALNALYCSIEDCGFYKPATPEEKAKRELDYKRRALEADAKRQRARKARLMLEAAENSQPV